MAGPSTVERVAPGDHICWAFSHDAHRLEATIRFVRAGLGAKHKVLCYTEAVLPVALSAAMESAGIDVTSATHRGQLTIATADETYLATGAFDAERVVASWRQATETAKAEGYDGIRVIADMTWAMRPVPGRERLPWYEAQVNRIFADGYTTAVCMYDRRLFTLADLSAVSIGHPATARPGDDGDWEPQLRIRRTAEPAGLRLVGEADLASRAALSAVLDNLHEDIPDDGPLTVDVRELRFADVAAARALVRAASTCRAGVRVVGASVQFSTLLRLVAGDASPGLTVSRDTP